MMNYEFITYNFRFIVFGVENLSLIDGLHQDIIDTLY